MIMLANGQMSRSDTTYLSELSSTVSSVIIYEKYLHTVGGKLENLDSLQKPGKTFEKNYKGG